MKKLLIASLLLFFAATTYAQNIQLHYDLGENRDYPTTTVEMFKPDRLGSTFFFVDMNYSSEGVMEAYWEIARELKVCDSPFTLHVEYNGGTTNSFSFNNNYLLGATYGYNSEDFSKGFSISAMYKYIEKKDQASNFQITGVWYLHFLDRKMTFSGFADFWKEENTVSDDQFESDFQHADYVFITEPQLWYNFNKSISLGTEIEISNNFAGNAGFMINPTVAAKYNF